MENKKLSLKNYAGYAIADLGNNIGFAVTSSYLTLFYTDFVGKNLGSENSKAWLLAVSILMIVARIWDGINDPIMGAIAQNSKPTKYGKFRKFLPFGVFLAFVFIIMFLPIKITNLWVAIIYASFTYIMYGMVYTLVLVPYGSLATVMTRDPVERSNLSIARTIGGGLGGIPAGMVFPSIIYYKYLNEDGKMVNGDLNPKAFFICILVIAAIMIVAYIVSFLTVEEKYPFKEDEEKISLTKTIKSLFKNKPFIIMAFAGMLLIASSMYINTIDVYLFNVYYGMNGLMLYVTIAIYVPMFVYIPLSGVIIKKLGKKEMCVYGLSVTVIASIIMSVVRFSNPWIFIGFIFIQECGVGFFTLEVWAMAMDVIDYQEMLTNKRDEAPCYAIFTFMRKMGQALAAIVPALLALINYDANKVATDATKNGIYTLATIVPLIMFGIMLILMIIYPLNKKNENIMKDALKELRANRGE